MRYQQHGYLQCASCVQEGRSKSSSSSEIAADSPLRAISRSLTQALLIMAPTGTTSMFDQAALVRRQQLQGASGPMAIVKNGKVFGIACFACIGG